MERMAIHGRAWCALMACACGPQLVADDGSTSGASHPFATEDGVDDDGDGDDEGEGGPPISVTITITASESGGTSGATTTTASTTAPGDTGTTTSTSPTESSDGNDATTAGLDFEPIVLGVGSAGFGPGEVSAFAELEHFIGEYDEDVCNMMMRCAGNTAPVIDDPILWVNGALALDASDIQLGDRVGLLFAFADAECNVGCGMTQDSIQIPGQSDGGGGSAHSNFPCDTTSTNVMLGVDFYEVEDAGDYAVTVGLRDVCDAVGNAMTTLPIEP
jgi:hypothetical protein